MRRAALLATFCAATLGLAQAARADEPSPELRGAVERALLEGRIADAVALVPRTSDAVWLADEAFGWRTVAGDGYAWTAVPQTALRFGLFPDPKPPLVVERKFALLAGLHRDRYLRMTMGAWTMPDPGPLATLPDPDGSIRRGLDVRQALYDHVPDEDSPDPEIAGPARQRIARARDLRDRSTLWAWIALGFLVGLTAAAAFLVSRIPERP